MAPGHTSPAAPAAPPPAGSTCVLSGVDALIAVTDAGTRAIDLLTDGKVDAAREELARAWTACANWLVPGLLQADGVLEGAAHGLVADTVREVVAVMVPATLTQLRVAAAHLRLGAAPDTVMAALDEDALEREIERAALAGMDRAGLVSDGPARSLLQTSGVFAAVPFLLQVRDMFFMAQACGFDRALRLHLAELLPGFALALDVDEVPIVHDRLDDVLAVLTAPERNLPPPAFDDDEIARALAEELMKEVE